MINHNKKTYSKPFLMSHGDLVSITQNGKGRIESGVGIGLGVTVLMCLRQGEAGHVHDQSCIVSTS